MYLHSSDKDRSMKQVSVFTSLIAVTKTVMCMLLMFKLESSSSGKGLGVRLVNVFTNLIAGTSWNEAD